MYRPDADTAQLQVWIDRLNRGEADARDELVRHACNRLERLARKMLRGFPSVQRLEETQDVLQGTLLRLCKALEDAPPASVRDFFCLAALQIRRELLDLSRHYYGPHGLGAHHASQPDRPDAPGQAFDAADNTHDPAALARLTEMHRQIDRLPAEEREVFDLLWYQELPQTEAAALVGVSVPTIKRRWLSARRRLHELLKAE